ncbi:MULTISPECIES: DUF2461 domain-containing protein [Sphingomonas]|uniref:DUF2461 domain-containing protein n=1 Tax=Sphingomonas TaxID=13687 RepID=UPI00254DB246|nr:MULTISPECIES: DUF2461 domain-containing protein [Sphingomonas]MDK8186983.1 DUF2461 domain-containing protein [Sphingomonas zeae]MDK8216809.1 DUF2461 domain-containing protein [Sphingomonas sp. UMB7805-LC452B]
MIDHKTFQFLRDLQNHNDKDWFENHRDAYNAAVDNLTDVAARLIDSAKSYDPAIGKLTLDPKDCISRIHRDMRFQKGKPPYKPDWFISIGDPQNRATAAYYLHVQPAESYAGGGVYTPAPEALKAIRHRIADQLDDWTTIVEGKALTDVMPGGIDAPEELKTIPQGFDKDDPAAEYLRMKGYVANRPLSNKDLESDRAHDLVVEAFAAAQPLVAFLNSALSSRTE